LDHTLRVWNAATGETVSVLHGPQPTVYLLKITPDSQSLITAETVATGTILRIWDIKTGKQIRLIKREDAAVSHLFFAGATLFVAEESGEDDSTGELTTYNLQTGRLLQTRQEMLCGVSANGKWIAIDRSTASARRAMIVDLPHDKPFATLTGQVSRVMFSTTGDWLAYESSAGDTAIVRRTAGGAAHTIHGHGAEFSMLALSPDGRWLATAGADFSVHIWDVESGKLAHGISGQYTPTAIAFSPDGRRVMVNGGGTDLGSALQFWDIENRTQVFAPKVKRSVSGLALSKDGAYLAVSASSVEVLETRTYASVAKFDCAGTAQFPTFSPNTRWIAANCGGAVTVWPISGAAELFHFGQASDANSGPLAFSPDSRYLAAATLSGLVLYDIAARKVVQTLATPDPPTALAFGPAGDTLAFGTRLRSQPKPDDRTPTLFLVDLHAHKKVWSAQAGQWVSALRFDREGRSLLAASGDDLHKPGALAVFDALSGKQIRRLAARVPNGAVAAFSPNGEWFAAGWNSATSLWRLTNR
jgi:WD40 repeat protein